MRIINIPHGQTEQSFREVKIKNIKRIIDLFQDTVKDINCFDYDFKIDIVAIETKLNSLLKKLQEK